MRLVYLLLLLGLFADSVKPTLLPTGLALLAAATPLKFLVALSGIKIGLLKLKLLKAHLVGPLAVGVAGKAAIVGTKALVAKKAAMVLKAKKALLQLPMKAAAMKIGAIAGAHAGAKAGVAGFRSMPKFEWIHPVVISASALLSKPVHSAGTPIVPPEPQEPSYGHKTPSRAPAAPAYAPAPEPHYRKRREVEETLESEDLTQSFREIFELMKSKDENLCDARTICELAVNPELLETYGPAVLGLLQDLSDDESEPWTPYKLAMNTGLGSGSPDTCARAYSKCPKTTEELIEEVKLQEEISA
ncbi:uncharacterized protein LOC100900867 [Galendromus occidentalis]|uniref:Uncharacterized protein LOC100900867 n=1 Tax=Galendromus occidentalis TaxID=34638 RepID=A0AAJ6QQL5_9ACAR|nr:uncharacterized protein LOC100900867 [Galendromus occidentalis]